MTRPEICHYCGHRHHNPQAAYKCDSRRMRRGRTRAVCEVCGLITEGRLESGFLHPYDREGWNGVTIRGRCVTDCSVFASKP